jgi:hypothetical protein
VETEATKDVLKVDQIKLEALMQADDGSPEDSARSQNSNPIRPVGGDHPCDPESPGKAKGSSEDGDFEYRARQVLAAKGQLDPADVDDVLYAPAFVPLPPPEDAAETPQEPTLQLKAFPEASELEGRRLHLCLAPDQAGQDALMAAADGAGAAWIRRWGGWHISIGQPVPSKGIDGLNALSLAVGESEASTFPWELRHSRYSLRVHKCGFGLPCFCQSLLNMVMKDEAIWLGPSKQLVAAAARLQKSGWAKVVSKDFHFTLGPKEEIRHVLSEMVMCLWEAKWVWVVGIETKPGSGEFAFEWDSARPAMAFNR